MRLSIFTLALLSCICSGITLEQQAITQNAFKDLLIQIPPKYRKQLWQLFEDFSLYEFEFGSRKFQITNNLQHCIWTHLEAHKLVQPGNAYNAELEDITSCEVYLFTVAALLHDIGKLGRYSLMHRSNLTEKAYWAAVAA